MRLNRYAITNLTVCACLALGSTVACGGGSNGPANGTEGDGDSGDGDPGDGDLGDGDMTGDGDTGGTSGDGDASMGGMGGEGAMEEVAFIESISPANGERGVPTDASVKVTFVEPMDTTSVEEHLDSSALPDFTIEWNEDGTEMTLDFVAALDFGVFEEAPVYGFVLGTGAKTASGAPLSSEFEYSFSTYRFDSLEIPLSQPSGMYAFDTMETGVNFYIGDSPDEDSHRAYLTFDLSDLPPEADIQSAIVETYQMSVQADPYGDLGAAGLIIIDSEFANVGDSPSNDIIGTLCSDATVGTCSSVVTTEVIEDWEDDRPAQFVLRFVQFSDDEGDFDRARLDQQQTTLLVDYIAH